MKFKTRTLLQLKKEKFEMTFLDEKKGRKKIYKNLIVFLLQKTTVFQKSKKKSMSKEEKFFK
jgi:hypothetical protein